MSTASTTTDDDESLSTTPTAATDQPQAPAAFDLGAKLAQRLREHTADRDRAQRRIDQDTAKLQHLFKSTPKRPRDTKSALQQNAKKLERDRTVRSMPLAQEKAILRQIEATKKAIRQHDQAEQHQVVIRKKKAEVEVSREAVRTMNKTISEIESALSKVELGKQLGCLPSEVISLDINFPLDKLNWVLGKGGANIKTIEEAAGVQLDVDKIRGKIHVCGSQGAVDDAIPRLEVFTKAIDEEVKISSDVIAYLLMQQSALLNKIKESSPDVKIDLLSTRITMRGHPDKVGKVKDDISAIQVVSQSRLLVGREASLVTGKTGSTIITFSEKHSVVMDMSKEGADKMTLLIIGPSDNVNAAMSEVDKLLIDYEDIEESIVVDHLLKTELLSKSGVGIKEFQRSLTSAIAVDHPEAGGVFLNFDRNSPKEEPPKLLIKCSRCVMKRSKSLVTKQIEQFESNVISIDVSQDMIPTIIGKGGGTINALRTEGKGALVETDVSKGVIHVYSSDSATRDTIRQKVDQIIAENQMGDVPIEKASIPFFLGESGKDVRNACTELGCNLNVSNDTKVVIKGTDEQIEQATELVKDFLAKNHVVELDVSTDDEPLLFMGGSDSILNKIEADHDVKATFRKGKGMLQLRGEADKANAALEDAKRFLNGGDGLAVCKFNVPEEAIGGVIGKGGSNLAKLQSDFEGVLVHVPKDNNLISIRGPEALVKQCRIQLITTIATSRVNENIDITPAQHEELSNSNVIKQISRFTNAQINMSETSIKVRGIIDDVRDAKTNIKEHLTGVYQGYIDLEGSQFGRVKSAITKDSSHFDRVQATTGAKVTLDDSDCAIHISGKKSNVKKAKASVFELLDFMLPQQLHTVKIHRSLFKPMGDPKRLAPIASEAGVSISLDRDMSSILIRSTDPKDCAKALELVNSMMVECQKLNVVMRLDASDAWLLSMIVGKGGSNIQNIEKETECSIGVFKDEVTIVLSAETEDIVQAGKKAVEDIIQQAKKECIFVELPESSMANFIGKGGAGIKKFSADSDVQVERDRKHPSTIKITGKEDCVACARTALLTWITDWEASHHGTTMDLEEKYIPLVLGKGGETVRSIEKETGCKIDVNRQNLTLTVRGGADADRKNAIDRFTALIEEEVAKTAERTAAGKAMARQEQAEIAQAIAMITGETKSPDPAPKQPPKEAPKQSPKEAANIEGTKDRSGEFAVNPVGMKPVTKKMNGNKEKDSNPDILSTEEGHQLYQWLITGKVGDLITGVVYPDSDSESPCNSNESDDSTKKAVIMKGNGDGKKVPYYQSESGLCVRL